MLIYVHQTFLDVFNDSDTYPTNCSFYKKMRRAMDDKGQLSALVSKSFDDLSL